MRHFSFIIKLFQAALLVAVVGLALHALTLPDPRDDMRRADALLADGQYLAALHAYQALNSRQPSGSVALRLGLLHSLRGEARPSENWLRLALRRGLRGYERELAYLYLGLQHAHQGRDDYAVNAWAQVAANAGLYPLRLMLQAEHALTSEEYALAEAELRVALAGSLPPAWHSFAAYRLGLLIAAREPAEALALLATIQPAPAAPLEQPLLPLLPQQAKRTAAQLRAVLQEPAPQRSQMLGQIYLDARFYTLADAQFAQVPGDSPTARSAAAYAAYSRWLAGDQQAGMSQLESLVRRYPDDTRARGLLAVAYLQLRDTAQAAGQLDTILKNSPGDPVTYLAWGQWYVVQGDYPRAAAQYQRAVAQAPPAERAGYALTAAEFYLSSGYGVCAEGRDFARQATDLAPKLVHAWTTRAALSYHCRDAAAAHTAAQRALMLDPHSAVASYYLGVALAALGQDAEARVALTRAADLEPASIWRQRAELQLQ